MPAVQMKPSFAVSAAQAALPSRAEDPVLQQLHCSEHRAAQKAGLQRGQCGHSPAATAGTAPTTHCTAQPWHILHTAKELSKDTTGISQRN